MKCQLATCPSGGDLHLALIVHGTDHPGGLSTQIKKDKLRKITANLSLGPRSQRQAVQSDRA